LVVEPGVELAGNVVAVVVEMRRPLVVQEWEAQAVFDEVKGDAVTR
jgi:hypothetical protein